MSIDFYKIIGIHQGFMEPFATASELDLIHLFKFHLTKSDKDITKYQPMPKNARLAVIQNGIELIRSCFKLEDILKENHFNEISEKSKHPFYDFLNATLFPSKKPPLLEVVFEILEWNCLGPTLWNPFSQILEFLVPDKYIEYLHTELNKKTKINGDKKYKNTLKRDLLILEDKTFSKKLFKKLCKH